MTDPNAVTASTVNQRLLPIGLWLIIMAVAAWVMLSKAQMSTDMAQFMPNAKTPVEKLLLEELDQGAASRLILVAITDPMLTPKVKPPLKPQDPPGRDNNSGASQSDSAIEQLAQFSRDFAAKLKHNDRFSRVDNGLRAKKDRKNQKLLFQYRYLLSPEVDANRFQPDQLHQILQLRLLELSSPTGLLNARTFPRDPSNELSAILDSLQSQQSANKQYGVWFSRDNSKALLMLQTQAPGFELDTQERNIADIRQIFSELDSKQQYELTISGTSVFATQSRDKIRSEITFLSTSASIVVLIILLLAYRSPSLALISALPLLSGVLIGAAGVVLIFGHIHGVTMAFGVTILGVAIDYPIHVFSHLNKQHSVTQNIQRIWPTLRLGVFTTATGYLAMSATNFSGLAQLSWFAILGLLSAAAITRWVVPACLPKHFAPASIQQPPAVFAHLLNPGKTAVVTTTLVATTAILFLLSTNNTFWENDLSALSPLPKDKLEQDRQLRSELGAPDVNHMVLINAKSAEQALQKSEQLSLKLQVLKNEGIIGAYDIASDFLPSRQTQLQRQSTLPDAQTLQQNLNTALQGLPFRKDQFDRFITAVQESRTLAPLTLEQLKNSALGLKLESMLFQRQDRWTALVILYDAQHPEELSQFFQNVNIPDVYYLNLKRTSNQLVSGFRGETLSRIQWSVLVILIVLWLGLRSWKHLLAATAPVISAIVTVLALLIAFGIPLSLFNLVAILLVFGIGIDYGLFFSRKETDIADKMRTFHALLVCCISTVSVFGILSLSHIPVLKDIGQTVSVGVLFSFLFAMSVSQRVKPA